MTGYLVLKDVGGRIMSIEVKLLRVEKFEHNEQLQCEITEIQSLQIADGNIPLGLELPIHMTLPKYFVAGCFEWPKVAVIVDSNCS